MAFAPIFIVGVPRSGTTLLRVLLDSHSQIAALPETPWLLGAYGPDPSLRGVLNGLIEGPYGTVRNIADIEPDHVFAAGRALLETMFAPLLEARGKTQLAFKTPADIRHLDFLLKLVPDAFYIHITRDGRDVAASQLAKKGTFFNDLKEYRRVGFANLLRRWAEWEGRIRALLYRDGVRAVHVKYEDLLADPSAELRRICDFLGVAFEAGMLDYGAVSHDYPAWEAGSNDVSRSARVDGAAGGKWRRARMTAEILHALMKYDHVLVEYGYPASALAPHPARRALARLYPLANPFLEAAAQAKRALHPLFRDRTRIAAGAGLGLLAAQFLLPQWGASNLDRAQPVLCFAVALGCALAIGPVLLRRARQAHRVEATLLKSAIGMGAYLALLEAAQNLAPGRHAGVGDLLLNMGAALTALLIAVPVLAKRIKPAQDRPALALAAQRA